MNPNKLRQLLSLGLLFLSTQLMAQNAVTETSLIEEIAAHEATLVAESFSIQQASTKAKIRHIQLSPDGQYLHYITNEKNGVALHLLDINSQHTETLFHSATIKRAFWSTDSKVLFLQSNHYLAFIDPFAPNAKARIFYRFDHQNEESFYGVDSSQAQQVLISRKVNTKNDRTPHHLLRINKKGEETILYADKVKIYDYLFDASGALNFIRQPDKEKHNIFQLNGKEKKLVFTCVVIDKCRMIKYNHSSQELTLLGVGEFNFISLFNLNIQSKEITLLHQDPEQISDLLNVQMDETTGEVIQLAYLSDHMRHYGLNDEWNNHYWLIESQLSGNVYISSRQKGNHWLIKQTHAQLHHHKYFIYKLSNSSLTPILESTILDGYPIAPETLVKNIPITYSASDGMTLYGYVMLPVGRKLSEVPLLTSIHGGPFSRVKGGYSPTQYLVNQGYAIFQPNFRSSTGYGIQYMLAGRGKFSTRVQEDIVDGIKYLLDQGIGDREKLGVFGHSFGGYSVLSLLASHPDLFLAGVATAPGTDLLELLKTMDHKGINEYAGVPLRAALPILLADMDNPLAQKQMKSTSPRKTWQGIRAPLLIWGGGKDERIPITNLRDYALKLKQAGQSIEFIEDKYTGHNPSLNDEVTPKAMLFLIAEFFNRHIRQIETESDAEIDDYLKRHRVY